MVFDGTEEGLDEIGGQVQGEIEYLALNDRICPESLDTPDRTNMRKSRGECGEIVGFPPPSRRPLEALPPVAGGPNAGRHGPREFDVMRDLELVRLQSRIVLDTATLVLSDGSASRGLGCMRACCRDSSLSVSWSHRGPSLAW
jgi:hypothetical protein